MVNESEPTNREILAAIVEDSFLLSQVGRVVVPKEPWLTSIDGGTQIILERPDGQRKNATVLALEHTQPTSFAGKNGILLSEKVVPSDVPTGTKIWKVEKD